MKAPDKNPVKVLKKELIVLITVLKRAKVSSARRKECSRRMDRLYHLEEKMSFLATEYNRNTHFSLLTSLAHDGMVYFFNSSKV